VADPDDWPVPPEDAAEPVDPPPVPVAPLDPPVPVTPLDPPVLDEGFEAPDDEDAVDDAVTVTATELGEGDTPLYATSFDLAALNTILPEPTAVELTAK